MNADSLKTVLVPINRAGWPFIAGALLLTVLLTLLWSPLVVPGLLLAAFCTYFFRDPDRVVPERQGLIVSPADGLVQSVAAAVPPAELEMGETPLPRISIFLNVFNVHVNRIPVEGRVTALNYRPGTFVNAALDKASEDNERQSVRVTLDDGRQVGFVQIAGLVARRIICDLKLGQEVATGVRFGLIRFGSRMDVYLPEGVAPLVVVGQTMVAGESILADMTTSEEARHGRPC